MEPTTNDLASLDRKIAAMAHKLNLFDLEEILDVAIEQIPAITQTHRVSIYVVDKDEQHLVFKRYSTSKLQDHIGEKISLDSDQTLITHAVRKKKPLLISNVEEYIKNNALPISLSKRQRYTSGSCMIVPIKVRLPNDHEKLLGVVNFAEKQGFTAFTKYDLELAGQVVEILGNAIHNSSVVEKKLGGKQKELMSELAQMKDAYAQKDIKLAEAKKKQAQMLPQLPQIPQYDIHVYYSPMETIGGDFYDFIQISEQEIGIVVGDVSGHGIEAALVMSMAKQVLSIYSKLNRSLIDTLVYANEEIFASLKGESFIAVFLGILNTSNNVLRYARAGQTYPVLYNTARQPNLFELKSNGVVIGTVRGEMFRNKMEEKHIQLLPHDTLLIYTDGAIEANNPQGEEFSTERLLNCLKTFDKGSAQELAAYMQKQIHDFSQSPQTDDITLLCLRTQEIPFANNVDTKRLNRELLQEAESFLITPEWTYQEDVHEQMNALEQTIKDLERELTTVKDEKHQLQVQCEELEVSLDMADKTPDSLITALRQQLKVALELPKELILENQRLHKELDEQQHELRSLDSEINQMTQFMEAMKSEYRRVQTVSKKPGLTPEKLAQYAQAMLKELTDSGLHFEKKIMDRLRQGDWEGAVTQLEGVLNLAFEKMDMAAMLSLQNQLLGISRIFLKHFQLMLAESKKEPKH